MYLAQCGVQSLRNIIVINLDTELVEILLCLPFSGPIERAKDTLIKETKSLPLVSQHFLGSRCDKG